MPEKIRIGFVGVGAMGQCAHLRNYVSLPGCEVVALAELRERMGREVARRYGIPKVYASHREMLAGEKLDAIVASQPFNRHGVLLPELLEARLPIFIEKPLSNSIPMGERILEALDRSGAWIMVGYHKRSDPATEHARSAIDGLKASGELGRMTYVRVTMPAGDWEAGGFTDLIKVDDEPRLGLDREPPAPDMNEETFRLYTSFVNYYIHQVNLLRHLLGEPYGATYADPAGVVFAGQSDGGVPCVLEMSPYRTTIEWQESALVCFERGYVRLDLPAPLASNRPGRVEILRDPAKGATPLVEQPHLPWVHAMRQQALNFVASVRGERKPPCEAHEAIEDLKVAREYIRLWKGV